MNKKENKGAILTGVIAAIAASSCCFAPIIAAVAGIGGVSSSLSWVEPLRPYLIVLAIVAIGYSWYVYLKPKKQDDCGCSVEKPKWYQSKYFLIGMTFFALISISFPYYSSIFYGKTSNRETQTYTSSSIQTLKANIEGMTCEACQNHINHSVNKLDGILNIITSYNNGTAVIKFDSSKVSKQQIEEAINSTGYSVINIKKQNNE